MPRKRPWPADISASSTGARVFAQQEIDVADDAGADRSGSVAAARAHRRGAIGEFDLAHRTKRVRSFARYIERAST